jgi:hypothetical protein
MGTQNWRIRYTSALILACFGCLLIGFSLVYPIYYASNLTSYRAYGGIQYFEVKPFFGTVSENNTEFYVDFDSRPYYDVTLEVRNFYTNNTPVNLILSTFYSNETVQNFYNHTTDPINHEFEVWDSDQFFIIIQYNGSAATFSFWTLLYGTMPIPPTSPTVIPFPYQICGSTFVFGLILLVVGLHTFRIQKRFRHSRNLDHALIFCCLGVLLITLSFPSLVRPHYYLYYPPPEIIDFGEFSGTVTQTVPRVNMTLWGVNECMVSLRTFFVTNASVTINAYILNGSLISTWNYVNSQYPEYRNFVFNTTGDAVIEVVRESEDTAFSCWVLYSFREVEIRQTYAGNYALYATVFLITGIILLGFGFHYTFKGFKELPKM